MDTDSDERLAANHAGELTRTVRIHMYQRNVILAFRRNFRAFEQLPHLEAVHLYRRDHTLLFSGSRRYADAS